MFKKSHSIFFLCTARWGGKKMILIENGSWILFEIFCIESFSVSGFWWTLHAQDWHRLYIMSSLNECQSFSISLVIQYCPLGWSLVLVVVPFSSVWWSPLESVAVPFSCLMIPVPRLLYHSHLFDDLWSASLYHFPLSNDPWSSVIVPFSSVWWSLVLGCCTILHCFMIPGP